MSQRPTVLVIAATDSSGGAGLGRDLRVLSDLGVDSMCAVTAVTAQSDRSVMAVHHVPPEVVQAQIRAAFDTRPVSAIKIGMLGTRATVEAVIERLSVETTVPIVLDPVLIASSGGILLDVEGRAAMRDGLFARATIVTPNIPEAAMLLGEDQAIDERVLISQAERLLALGPQAILLKGGHAGSDEAVDLLIRRDGGARRIASARVRANHRGTGCALASAIAAGLACGSPLAEACSRAKRYVLDMLSHAK